MNEERNDGRMRMMGRGLKDWEEEEIRSEEKRRRGE